LTKEQSLHDICNFSTVRLTRHTTRPVSAGTVPVRHSVQDCWSRMSKRLLPVNLILTFPVVISTSK